MPETFVVAAPLQRRRHLQMHTIYKYPIEITDSQKVLMPQGAQILTAQFNNGRLCLWALVNASEAVLMERTIRIQGTGNPVADPYLLKYIGTDQHVVNGTTLVWHVFEETK
jgi:hypothetical protein